MEENQRINQPQGHSESLEESPSIEELSMGPNGDEQQQQQSPHPSSSSSSSPLKQTELISDDNIDDKQNAKSEIEMKSEFELQGNEMDNVSIIEDTTPIITKPVTLDDTFLEAALFPGWSFTSDKFSIDETVLMSSMIASVSQSSKAQQTKFNMKRNITKAISTLEETAADIESISYDIKCVKILRQREQKHLPELRAASEELKTALDNFHFCKVSTSCSGEKDVIVAKQKYKAACVAYQKCIKTINECENVIDRLERTLTNLYLRFDQMQTQSRDVKVLSQAIGASDKIQREKLIRNKEKQAALASQTVQPFSPRFSAKEGEKAGKLGKDYEKLQFQRAKVIQQRYRTAVQHINLAKMEADNKAVNLLQRKQEALSKISEEMRQIHNFTKVMAKSAVTNKVSTEKSEAEGRKLAILEKLQREEAIADKTKKKSTFPTVRNHVEAQALPKGRACNPVPSPLKPGLNLSIESIVYPATALGSSCSRSLSITLNAEDIDIRWPWAKVNDAVVKNEDEIDEVRFEFRTPKLVSLKSYQLETDTWIDVLYSLPAAVEERKHDIVNVILPEDSQPRSSTTSASTSRAPRDVSSASSRNAIAKPPLSKLTVAEASKELSQEFVVDGVTRPSSSSKIIQSWSWNPAFPSPFNFYPQNGILKPGSQQNVEVLLSLPTPGVKGGLPLVSCGGATESPKEQQISPQADENGNKPVSARKKKSTPSKDNRPQTAIQPLVDPSSDLPQIAEQKDWIKRLLAFKEAKVTYEITCAVAEAAAPSSRLSSLISGLPSQSEWSKKRLADSPNKKFREDLLLSTTLHIVQPHLVLYMPLNGIIDFGQVPIDEELCKNATLYLLSENIQPIYRFEKSDGCFEIALDFDSNDLWSKEGMAELPLVYKPIRAGIHKAILGLYTATTQVYVHLVGFGVIPCVNLEPTGINVASEDWMSKPIFAGDALCNDPTTLTIFQLSNTGDVAAKVSVWIESTNEHQSSFKIINPVDNTIMLAAQKTIDCSITFTPLVAEADCRVYICVDVWGQKIKYKLEVLGRSWASTAAMGGIETCITPTLAAANVKHDGEHITTSQQIVAQATASVATDSIRTMILKLPWVQDSAKIGKYNPTPSTSKE